jgi:mannose-6-phosphate isomerase-like protein (cupin superfamily)
MYELIRDGQIRRSSGGTLKFEGEPYGSGVSFFLVDNEPGAGPDLHRHPYSETWIVREGKVRFTAAGDDIDAETGDIVVVNADVPHKFKNVGAGRLDLVCIHSAPRMVQEELEEDATVAH